MSKIGFTSSHPTNTRPNKKQLILKSSIMKKERKIKSISVCVYVCVCEREIEDMKESRRERECVSERERTRHTQCLQARKKEREL